MESWDHFEFIHEPPNDLAEEMRQIDLIHSKVAPQVCGVYAYAMNGEWIYVGKGAPLCNRLRDHYRIAYRELSGDTNDKRWHRYWSSRHGRLTVYWKQVDSETDRRIVELALKEVLKPVFEQFR